MRGNELLDKMELIVPAYVEAAETEPKVKKNIWIKWWAVAACLCLTAIGATLWRQPAPTPSEDNELTAYENGVTIPQLNVSLSANEEGDMIAFFIYQGRCYVQYEWIYDDADIVGEYLGTAIGLIDEWTPEEGYVELAGSTRGDFYAVKGYDPSFMLCMKENGAVTTYICNNGITLKYGSELYEDRLHLSGGFESVRYESRDSWYYSRDEYYQLSNDDDMILDFIAAMDSTLFIPCDTVPLDEGITYITETELYHLFFRMKNGMTVHLRLHENGYVCFDGMLALCIQVPEESYNAMLNLLDNHTDSAE